ncbi:hypothetical protein JST97_37340 [bacterium]|nr:hypothetical protein [bacterium]
MNNHRPRTPQRRATPQELDDSLNRAILNAERKTKAAPEQEAVLQPVIEPLSWALPIKGQISHR